MWTKECSNDGCMNTTEYTNKRSWYNAKRNESMCKDCARNATSKTLKKRYKSGDLKVTKQYRQEKKYFRDCPECGEPQGYTTKRGVHEANRLNRVCNSCSAYKYNKTWNEVITDGHIKQMRATKAGFDSWEEYVEGYPEKEFYKREVWSHTYKQDLEGLTNYDKRGRCGVDGAYQIDHVVSINEGWEQGIPPEEIGDISNLRMIPWEENRSKG